MKLNLEKIKNELIPLIQEYKGLTRQERMEEQYWPKINRINKLSGLIFHYYIDHKKWESIEEFDGSMREIDPFGFYNHRMSIAIRVLKIRKGVKH